VNKYVIDTKKRKLIEDPLDQLDVVTVAAIWGAPVFATNTVYRNDDRIRPAFDNGYYYICVRNGRTGNEAPLWDSGIIRNIKSGEAVFSWEDQWTSSGDGTHPGDYGYTQWTALATASYAGLI
jgi:hypothetical protein